MPFNKLGDARRSAVIMNYGPGAVVDFRVPGTGAPVSVVAGGLETWDECTTSCGLANRQTIFEPRLQKKLGVAGFRLPPVSEGEGNTLPDHYLAAARFPGWLQCPECESLKQASKWASEPGDPSRYCSACSSRQNGGRKIYTVPVRFVVACEHGHLDDFPWHQWVRHKGSCQNRNRLKILSKGAGLAGLHVQCGECKAERTLENIFKRHALQDMRCTGRRPWLKTENQECRLTSTTLQRGASNLYYPQIVSAIDIPPWSDNIQKSLGQYWDGMIQLGSAADRKVFLTTVWNQLPLGDRQIDDVARAIEARISAINEPERENLRWDEYKQLCVADETSVSDEEFDIRSEQIPARLQGLISKLVRVLRLREVRALTGFTRIDTPRAAGSAVGGRPPSTVAFLSASRKNWLPAIEVRGEGIFFEFDPEALANWESKQDVSESAARISVSLVDSMCLTEEDKGNVTNGLTARFLLCHTIAHVLMRQLSLQSGYSSASLRERLYLGEHSERMCGVMIYTASADSDGTLGGLQRQGKSSKFGDTCIQALESIRWCSSDPLCFEGVSSETEPTNLAACHSCVLTSETSCEEFNRYLDRSVLVGRPENRDIGFFSSLFEVENRD